MVVLYFIHRRGRDDEHEKRTQYWREQVRFLAITFDAVSWFLTSFLRPQTAMRQNIMQMKESARTSGM